MARWGICLIALGACAFEVPGGSSDNGGDGGAIHKDGATDGGDEADGALGTDGGGADGATDVGVEDSGVDTDGGLLDAAEVDTGSADASDAGGNTAPIALPTTATVGANRSVTFALRALDTERDPLTFMIDAATATGSVSLVNGIVTYTAARDVTYATQFRFTASDGELTSNTATVSVRVYDDRSCLFIKRTLGARGQSSGIYTIDTDLDGPRPPLPVYCDMTLGNGGWTMIGRSVVGAPPTSSVGWKQSNGAPDDDGTPYSMDVEAAGLVFGEVLATSYSTGKTMVDAHHMFVFATFLSNCSNSGCQNQGAQTLLGPCTGPGGKPAFQVLGRTNIAGRWFFNEEGEADNFGLFANGYSIIGDSCDDAGMDGDQGMIFVRCTPEHVDPVCPLQNLPTL